jgi:hypothetical protein
MCQPITYFYPFLYFLLSLAHEALHPAPGHFDLSFGVVCGKDGLDYEHWLLLLLRSTLRG